MLVARNDAHRRAITGSVMLAVILQSIDVTIANVAATKWRDARIRCSITCLLALPRELAYLRSGPGAPRATCGSPGRAKGFS